MQYICVNYIGVMLGFGLFEVGKRKKEKKGERERIVEKYRVKWTFADTKEYLPITSYWGSKRHIPLTLSEATYNVAATSLRTWKGSKMVISMRLVDRGWGLK